MRLQHSPPLAVKSNHSGILIYGDNAVGSIFGKASSDRVSQHAHLWLLEYKVVDSEGRLLDALQKGSEVLQNITDVCILDEVVEVLPYILLP